MSNQARLLCLHSTLDPLHATAHALCSFISETSQGRLLLLFHTYCTSHPRPASALILLGRVATSSIAGGCCAGNSFAAHFGN
eukprot:60383-Prorocentrum_minimum.AAC.1